MAKCKYCGIKAGLFKEFHGTCEEELLKGQESIISQTKDAVFNKSDLNLLKSNIETIASKSFIDNYEPLILKGLEFIACIKDSF